MFKKTAALFITLLALGACSSSSPRIIQATTGMPDINLTIGMATQVEMPDSGHVQSVTVGDPSLVEAAQAGEVVNLVAKGKDTGETNMIIRSRENDGEVKIYQYRIIVQGR